MAASDFYPIRQQWEVPQVVRTWTLLEAVTEPTTGAFVVSTPPVHQLLTFLHTPLSAALPWQGPSRIFCLRPYEEPLRLPWLLPPGAQRTAFACLMQLRILTQFGTHTEGAVSASPDPGGPGLDGMKVRKEGAS